MPVTVSYPGVYVQEEASGARAIAGVATSVALFIGMANKGRMNTPVEIFNFADFEREFGSTTDGELATQVSQFFLNGGGRAWVCRIADNATQAAVMLNDEQARDCLQLTARDHGAEGNLIRAEVDYDTLSPDKTFNLSLYRSRVQADGTSTREDEENYFGLSMNPDSGSYVESMINGASAIPKWCTTQTITGANPSPSQGISCAGPASGVLKTAR